jgi:hypothetical protein
MEADPQPSAAPNASARYDALDVAVFIAMPRAFHSPDGHRRELSEDDPLDERLGGEMVFGLSRMPVMGGACNLGLTSPVLSPKPHPALSQRHSSEATRSSGSASVLAGDRTYSP